MAGGLARNSFEFLLEFSDQVFVEFLAIKLSTTCINPLAMFSADERRRSTDLSSAVGFFGLDGRAGDGLAIAVHAPAVASHPVALDVSVGAVLATLGDEDADGQILPHLRLRVLALQQTSRCGLAVAFLLESHAGALALRHPQVALAFVGVAVGATNRHIALRRVTRQIALFPFGIAFEGQPAKILWDRL